MVKLPTPQNMAPSPSPRPAFAKATAAKPSPARGEGECGPDWIVNLMAVTLYLEGEGAVQLKVLDVEGFSASDVPVGTSIARQAP